ncbi:MAG: asparagine synthase-related protein, partial [Candidatus Cloacimonadaceae bacterium]|nr:asparagine synthase-related protein [Candidatus Cloacimonadaceae bacterium]
MFLAVSSPDSFDTSIMAGMHAVYSKIDADQRCVRVFHQDSPRPVEDSFIEGDDRGFYLFEGVVVNDGELINQYALPDVKTLLKTALSEDSMRIAKQLHGQFCGLYIDLEAKLIRAFTNQINSLRVFYYQSDDVFIAGTSIRLINQLLKANQISTGIDETGARMVMTYGFMLSDYTTIKEIRHLQAGQYVAHRKGRTLVEAYHSFDNEPQHHDEKQILPRLNELFSSSVRMSFEKDIACGQKHLAFLSGGLDSRQVVMTANQLGYKDVTCLNFTQPGYADELIARKITRLMKYRMLFYSLDRGTYLLNLEDNLRYNEGQVLLHGAAHLYAGIASIDYRQYGILHSGQLGDSILGSFLKTPAHTSVDLASGA